MPPEWRGVWTDGRAAVNDILGEPADFWECHVIYGVYRKAGIGGVTVVSRGTNILERSCVPPAGASERVQGRSAGGDQFTLLSVVN